MSDPCGVRPGIRTAHGGKHRRMQILKDRLALQRSYDPFDQRVLVCKVYRNRLHAPGVLPPSHTWCNTLTLDPLALAGMFSRRKGCPPGQDSPLEVLESASMPAASYTRNCRKRAHSARCLSIHWLLVRHPAVNPAFFVSSSFYIRSLRIYRWRGVNPLKSFRLVLYGHLVLTIAFSNPTVQKKARGLGVIIHTHAHEPCTCW